MSDMTHEGTGQYDAREGDGDLETDPAAMGEVSAALPDADGGAVADEGAELSGGTPPPTGS